MKDNSSGPKADLSAHLKTSILTMQLLPGADLDEGQLSSAFGLSRTPLREVFRELAGQGFLSLHTGRGARVSEMSHTTLRDFFQAAPMIYGAILRLAAMHATSEQISALKAAQAAFQTALDEGSPAERALCNNRFHEITGEMAGNVYLLPSFHRLLIDHARIGMTFYQPSATHQPETMETANAQHEAIIAAIASRDAETAARLAEEHWQLSRGQIETFVMPQSLNVPLGALSPEMMT